MRKKAARFVLVLALFSSLYSCQSQRHFVKVNGNNFVINQKPYFFVGTNLWYGAYLGADTDYGNRDRLLRELDRLQKLEVKNLRVVAASEESDFGRPLSPPFQYKDDRYNEDLLQGLDFLLAEMGKRDMRAVLVLNNYWDWSGGMSEYVSWATGEDVIDPTVDKNVEWSEFLDFSARFYQLEEAQKRYRKYIGMLAERQNSYTDKLYKNDPTIMTWELANEPRPSQQGDSEESMKVFSEWIDQTASYIDSLDKNHLVTTGSEGSNGTLNQLDYARQAHESKQINYLTIHLWPKNWGWYKADQPQTMDSTQQNTIKYIAEHIDIARELDKPAVLEEFGFMRDGEKYSAKSPVSARNEYYQFVFQLVQDSINAGSPLVGVNFWGWGGEGRARHEDHQWRVGDNMCLGDPYAEAQGLNSIYDTDESTLEIISKFAKNLEQLSERKNNAK